MRSLIAPSKLASDVMVQEYARYFGLRTCCLRGGCLTGPNHAGVELHGFLSYLLKSPFGNTTFSAGIRNILDQNPPLVYNSFLTYADPGYDFVGRFVYGRITHNF